MPEEVSLWAPSKLEDCVVSKRLWNDVLLLNSKISSLSGKSEIWAYVPTCVFELNHHSLLWDEKKHAVRDDISNDLSGIWSDWFHTPGCAECKNSYITGRGGKRKGGKREHLTVSFCPSVGWFLFFFFLSFYPELGFNLCLILLLVFILFMLRCFLYSLLMHWLWPNLKWNPIKPHVYSSHKSLGSSGELVRKSLQVNIHRNNLSHTLQPGRKWNLMDRSSQAVSSLLDSCCLGPHTDPQTKPCHSDVWKLSLLPSLPCCLQRHVQELLTQSLLTLLSQEEKEQTAPACVSDIAQRGDCSQHLSFFSSHTLPCPPQNPFLL